MLDHDDLKWIAATSTELNSMLQQIARYADLARQHKGQYNYIDLLAERVEMSSKTAQALFDRVTSSILSSSISRTVGAKKSPNPAFRVVPEPSQAIAALSRALAQAAPKKESAPEPRSVPVPADPPEEIRILNAQGTRELILLVDDEVELTELAAEMLTTEGYKVILAKDGFEALRIYGRMGNQIGLVILDFFLPVMDGDAVFDELRALNPNINVVLSSGFAEQSKLGAMLALGLRGFIPKPYTREKLLAQVRSTLDAPRAPAR
jgi:CheY-like chemotaxis protein